MARLDGKQKSPLPLIIGVAVLLLAGAGGYFLLANRGADGVAVQNGSVKIVDTKPGGLLEKSPESQQTNAENSSAVQSSDVSANATPAPTGAPADGVGATTSTQDQNTATLDQNAAANSSAQPDAASTQENSATANSAMVSPSAMPGTLETPAVQSTQAPDTSATATP